MSERANLLPGQQFPPNYGQPPPPYYQPAPATQPVAQSNNTIIIHQAQPAVVCQRSVVVPPDYTCLAITAVICFFPLGLLALYMASKAKDSVAAHDFNKAWGEAVITRILSRVSISIGTFLIILTILGIVLPIALGGDDD